MSSDPKALNSELTESKRILISPYSFSIPDARPSLRPFDIHRDTKFISPYRENAIQYEERAGPYGGLLSYAGTARVVYECAGV